MTTARIQTPDVLDAEEELERSLRPRRLEDFVIRSRGKSIKAQLLNRRMEIRPRGR